MDWTEIPCLNTRRSNGFEQLFEALRDLKSLNKDSDEFCLALHDGRGDNKSFVKSCKPSPSHGTSDDQVIVITVYPENLVVFKFGDFASKRAI